MRKHNNNPAEIGGLKVTVYNDRFDKAHSQFKKKVQNSGILQEAKDRQFYEKPTTVKRRKKNAAKRRFQKQLATAKNIRQMY